MNRNKLYKEGIKRIQYLVSLGLDKEILQRFKTTGIVSVCEASTTGWRQKRKYENKGSTNTLSFFPRTYPLLDYMENVSEEMVEIKNTLEVLGYLVYLVVRTKINNKDYLDYLVIDKENEFGDISYEYDYSQFIGLYNPTLCFTKTKTTELSKGYKKFEMFYGNFIRKGIK